MVVIKMYDHVLEHDRETWFIDFIEYRMLKLCKQRTHDNKCIQNYQTKKALFMCIQHKKYGLPANE